MGCQVLCQGQAAVLVKQRKSLMETAYQNAYDDDTMTTSYNVKLK